MPPGWCPDHVLTKQILRAYFGAILPERAIDLSLLPDKNIGAKPIAK